MMTSQDQPFDGDRQPSPRVDDVAAESDGRADRAGEREVLLVLGMHRSGTSALAGCLARLGVAVPRTPLPTAADNEQGYYESAPVVRFNDEMLAAAGSFALDWRAIDPDWLASRAASSFGRQGLQLIADEFGDARRIVLKDPRICRLMPFWRDILARGGYRPLVILPFRHPASVAASLKARDQVEQDRAALVWLRHVLDAEASSRDVPRCFLAMRQIVDDWRGSIASVQRHTGTRLSFDMTQATAIDAFLKRDLVHHHGDHDDQAAAAAPWIMPVPRALAMLADDPSDGRAFALLDDVKEQFDRSEGIFSSIGVAVEHELNQALIGRSEAQREAEDLRMQVGAAASGHHSLEAQIAALRAAMTDVTSERDGIAARLAEAQATMTWLSRATGATEELVQIARTERDRAWGALEAEQNRYDQIFARLLTIEGAMAEERRLRADEIAYWRGGAEGWKSLTDEKQAFIEHAVDDLRRARTREEALQARCSALEAEIAGAAQDLDIAHAERDVLRAHHDEAEQAVRTSSEALTAAHADAEALRARLERADAVAAAIGEERDACRTEIERLRQSAARHARRIDELVGRCTEAEDRLAARPLARLAAWFRSRL